MNAAGADLSQGRLITELFFFEDPKIEDVLPKHSRRRDDVDVGVVRRPTRRRRCRRRRLRLRRRR